LKRIRLKRGVDTVEEDTVEEGGVPLRAARRDAPRPTVLHVQYV
jgi:hypothetical protein